MAVFSKMSGNRSRRTGASTLALGAGALMLGSAAGFIAPGAARQLQPHVASSTGSSATSSSTSGFATAATVMGGATLAAGMSRKGCKAGKAHVRGQKSVVYAKKEISESGLEHLDVLSRPEQGHQIGELKALAAELRQKPNFQLDGPLRWVASMAASFLLSQSMALQPAQAGDAVNYSEFIDSVNKGDVEMVRVQPDQLSAQYITKDGARREVNLIPNLQIEDQLFNQLADKKVDVVMQNAEPGSPLDFLARFAGPLAWLVAGLLLLFGGVGGGPAGPGGPGGNPFELGKSKARILKDGDTKAQLMQVKFGDVAGCDGAKTELVEVVDFLKNASRYSDLGAKIPKGALLVGPPGLTLLDVSEVQDSDKAGSKNRVVMAATNRADILDKALVRPGRFDRQIQVDPPDVQGRYEILKVHAKGKNLAPGVDLLAVARQTPGMSGLTRSVSGADLANLLNEGAIMAARKAKTEMDSDDSWRHAKGLTWFTPGEDQSLISAAMLKAREARIAGALGGRVAEKLVFGDSQVTTGAGGDLQQVERMARAMVTQFGMSEARLPWDLLGISLGSHGSIDVPSREFWKIHFVYSCCSDPAFIA
eukprot:Skav218293  [mRNA]  locus=scaffold2388:18147:31633:+ [translate_table: standard]